MPPRALDSVRMSSSTYTKETDAVGWRFGVCRRAFRGPGTSTSTHSTPYCF